MTDSWLHYAEQIRTIIEHSVGEFATKVADPSAHRNVVVEIDEAKRELTLVVPNGYRFGPYRLQPPPAVDECSRLASDVVQRMVQLLKARGEEGMTEDDREFLTLLCSLDGPALQDDGGGAEER